MLPRVENFFEQGNTRHDIELFDNLFEAEDISRVWIERIVSNGQISPLEGWYDQESTEVVVLMKGTATIDFISGDSVEALGLTAGDYITIPPHLVHRVSAVQDAVWLAVHAVRKVD